MRPRTRWATSNEIAATGTPPNACLYRQSLRLREELGDRSGIAWVTSDRGANELGRGNLELAETLLQDAFTQTQQLGMTDLLAEIHWHFAQLYRAKNNPNLAQHHYTTAHQIYTQLGAAKDLEEIEQEWSGYNRATD